MRKKLKKLNLNRETLVCLNGPPLRAIYGGDDSNVLYCHPTRQPSVCRACEWPTTREP